ncbi:hypothetical protein VitviT2T_021618 [Vitis vinifera]|uniref:Disease resistance protein At4g27190-like leucine-rich repeats domain-containing protein n=1 Tax=Vitis vinifera TaxID=29760 RepID=A0ABY9D7I9_VITVI|nr:hypothetical protein VitviT2T_021618 [Vitis vinifera]
MLTTQAFRDPLSLLPLSPKAAGVLFKRLALQFSPGGGATAQNRSELLLSQLYQCASLTLMSEPKPCRGAHGLGLLLSLPVSGSASTSHGIAPMAVPSWCTGHCTPVLCIGIRVLVGCLSDAPSGHGIAPMVFLVGLLAQGLGALVLARGGARPHHAPCCCSHGLHATHVVEPMCACSIVMPGCLLGAVKARPCKDPSDGTEQALLNKLASFDDYIKENEVWHGQIPFESFGNLHSLHVENCASLLKFLPSFLLRSLRNLEVVILKNCDLLEEVFDLEGIDVNNEYVRLLSKLKKLTSIGLPKLRHICNKDPRDNLCFQNLKWLNVDNCGSLRNLFLPSMASDPMPLGGVEVMAIGNIVFPQLTHLSLEFLPNLTSVYPGCHSLQQLDHGNLDVPFGVLFNENVSLALKILYFTIS